MIRAILDGKKTQTRRLVKPQPAGLGDLWPDDESCIEWGEVYCAQEYYIQCGWCPYGHLGDRLWVRETWMCDEYGRRHQSQGMVRYRADAESMGAWRPSIFMPRWASRLTLENVGVRVERVQDISDDDILAEGFPEDPSSYAEGFAAKWGEINPKHPWSSNPWVWVIEFKRVEP